MLPMEENPVEADWHIMHLVDKPIPKVAAAFQDFVIENGQEVVRQQLEDIHRVAARLHRKRKV